MSKYIFECIDAHTCGNPVRLILTENPKLKGKTMSEKRLDFLKNHDWIRKSLMFEPRGHDMMSGGMIYLPENLENDFSILFLETSGCLPMCGHGTIGIVTIVLEENLIKPKVEGVLKIEVPAGTIEVNYKMKNEKVEWVEIKNVDSYLADKNLIIHSDGLGEIKFDVSYGGNFYAIIENQKNYLGLKNYKAEELISFSREIRDKINKKYPNRFIHPIDKSIRDVSHILWTGQVIDNESSSRNAVFYGDKAIDRSPCGTGSSARMAQLFSQNKLKVGEVFIHESYIGSKFVCRIEKSSKIQKIDGISPVIKGWAKIIGYNKIIVDSSDPFYNGFQVI
jgi:4-hydroxyproline epimerase